MTSLQDSNSGDVEKGLTLNSTNTPSLGASSVPASPTTTSSKGSRRLLLGSWSRVVGRFYPSANSQQPNPRAPLVRPIHGGPRGYPELAAFLDSDENFMTYRRFGFVQARLLLEKQERLRLLEVELDNLDKEQTGQEGDEDVLCTLNVDEEFKEARDELMGRVETAFNEYADLLQKSQGMVAMNRPTPSEYRSVENYIDNEKPLLREEATSFYWKEDLISLRPGREHAWLDATIETFLRKFNCRFIEWAFCSKETRLKTEQPHEIYYTRSRIERAVVTIITFMILFLLILPIYLLFKLTEGAQTSHSNALCIGVLLVFTLAFSAVISLFTRAQRHEILAASAAYCAVLVVFFGNVNINSNPVNRN